MPPYRVSYVSEGCRCNEVVSAADLDSLKHTLRTQNSHVKVLRISQIGAQRDWVLYRSPFTSIEDGIYAIVEPFLKAMRAVVKMGAYAMLWVGVPLLFLVGAIWLIKTIWYAV